MKIGIIKDERFLNHRPSGYHPENPQRLRIIYDWLKSNPVPDSVELKVREATEEEILLVHSPSYLNDIKDIDGKVGNLDADTYYSKDSYRIALLAAGSLLSAGDSVMHRAVSSAFAFIRPPGHHAERDRAMGFCIFNNVAIAARYIQKAHGLKRILIVDWDLHHGNGTQWAFYNDPTVLYFSTHQYPYYPGTGGINECGTGKGEGFNINVPLPPGMGDSDYVEIFNRILMPVADEFKPEFVIVSAGFDAHKDDPLGGMALTENGFGALTGILMEVAKRHASGRLLLALEGGYKVEALRDSVRSVFEAIHGNPKRIDGKPSDTALDIIERVIKFNKRYWPTL